MPQVWIQTVAQKQRKSSSKKQYLTFDFYDSVSTKPVAVTSILDVRESNLMVYFSLSR
jgi:hypothetical protein